MMTDTDLRINAAAQGLADLDDLILWFGDLDEGTRLEVLDRLHYFCFQSHPRPDEIEEAIERSRLKPTMTPCVILRKNHVHEALQKIVALPMSEQIKSVKLLIALLAVADGRRRATECANGCSHEWHNIQVERRNGASD